MHTHTHMLSVMHMHDPSLVTHNVSTPVPIPPTPVVWEDDLLLGDYVAQQRGWHFLHPDKALFSVKHVLVFLTVNLQCSCSNLTFWEAGGRGDRLLPERQNAWHYTKLAKVWSTS